MPPVLVAWDGSLAPLNDLYRSADPGTGAHRAGARRLPRSLRRRVRDDRATSHRLPPPHGRGLGPGGDQHDHRRAARGVAPAGIASELGRRDSSRRPPLGAEPVAGRPAGPRVPLPMDRRAGRGPGHGRCPWRRLSIPESPEPSPYSPVSRLFWSELILDLGEAHRPAAAPAALDVTRGDAEVRAALAGHPVPPPAELDEELVRYARFRGAQARLGRNWRDWPPAARAGTLDARAGGSRGGALPSRGPDAGAPPAPRSEAAPGPRRMRLGLDLAVGGHPDGYDPWSRQALFGEGMSVGAPPDQGFPSGQDWGFSPVLPGASRREGHRYLAASIAHQAGLAGVLRVDHIMAWTRLYWIPHGFGLDDGHLCLVSRRGVVRHAHTGIKPPPVRGGGREPGHRAREIDEALPRHRIWGMYLAEFEASDGPEVAPPTAADMALVGTPRHADVRRLARGQRHRRTGSTTASWPRRGSRR